MIGEDRKRIKCLVACLLSSSPSLANGDRLLFEPSPVEISSPSHRAYGNAGLSHGRGIEGMFRNPAAPARNDRFLREFSFPYVSLGGTKMVRNAVQAAQKGELEKELQSVSESPESIAGKSEYLEVQTMTGIAFKYVGLAVFSSGGAAIKFPEISKESLDAASSLTEASSNNETPGEIPSADELQRLERARNELQNAEVQGLAVSRSGAILNYNRSTLDDRLFLGVSVKGIIKTESGSRLPLFRDGSNEQSTESESYEGINAEKIPDSVTRSPARGFGVGGDIGVVYSDGPLAAKNSTRVSSGIVLRNAGGIRYSPTTEAKAPTTDRQRLDLGVGVEVVPPTKSGPRGAARLAVDYRDATGEAGLPAYRRPAAGFELAIMPFGGDYELTSFGGQVGMANLRPQFGAFVDLPGLRIEGAVLEESFSSSPDQKLLKVYTISLRVGLTSPTVDKRKEEKRLLPPWISANGR